MLAEAHDLPEENLYKELPLTSLEDEEFITSIVSSGNILEYTVYKPAPQIITVMANPNPAVAQIIARLYIGYNRINQPRLPAQRPQLTPQPQQVLQSQASPAYNLQNLGTNNNNNNNPLLVVIGHRCSKPR